MNTLTLSQDAYEQIHPDHRSTAADFVAVYDEDTAELIVMRAVTTSQALRATDPVEQIAPAREEVMAA